MGDGSKNKQTLPSIRADLIQYTQPSTKLTTPVLRISPLSPLAENTRYMLVLGEGIRTSYKRPLKMPKAYFQLLSNFEVTASPSNQYIQSLHALADQVINTITQTDRKPVFATSFTTVAPKAEMQRLIGLGSELSGPMDQYVDERIFPSSSVFNQLLPRPRAINIIEGPLTLLDMVKEHSSMFPKQFEELLNTNDEWLEKILTKLIVSDIDTGVGFDWPKVSIYLGSIELPYALNPFNATTDEKRLSDDRFNKNTDVADVPFIQVPFILVAPSGNAPAGGWPVAIYQHGVLGDRVNALLPGIAMASLCNKELDIIAGEKKPNDCYATLAIDLPLHGVPPRWVEEFATDYSEFSRKLTYKMLSVPGRLKLLRDQLDNNNSFSAESDCNLNPDAKTYEHPLCKAYRKHKAWLEVKERHF